jgi:hypothetical protein
MTALWKSKPAENKPIHVILHAPWFKQDAKLPGFDDVIAGTTEPSGYVNEFEGTPEGDTQ